MQLQHILRYSQNIEKLSK